MKTKFAVRNGLVLLALLLATSGLLADEAKPVIPPPPVAMTITTPPTTVRVSRPAQAIVQERLQPSTPDKLIAKHGPVGAIFARPQRVNPLQLINPLAPTEYGDVGATAAAWSWNPMLSPGQGPLPRAFQDDRTHEASGVIFSVGGR